jgi:hypothetical glycosyl hydrolase
MLTFDRGTAELEQFIITETAFDAQAEGGLEAIFCQGNGYLGQRAALEERYAGQARNLFVTGTFDRFHDSEVTELPNLPDLTNLTLTVDGVPFSMERGELVSCTRELNLQTGELTRRVLWRPPHGGLLTLCFRRFVSLAREHLLGFQVEVTCTEAGCAVTVESGIDGTVTNSGTQHLCERVKRLIGGRILFMEEETVQSGIGCRLHAAHTFAVDGCEAAVRRLPIMRRRYLGEAVSLPLQKGQTLRVEKLCCVSTTRDLTPTDGVALLYEAAAMGYGGLLRESAAAWAVLWATQDIRIDARDGYDQVAVRFALYHLNIMVKKDDDRVGIGAKGLSGEGYKGHSFWDTEIFLLPYYTFTQPDTARTLLRYRHRILDGARRKARDHGYRGAMYPWESAWIDDGEVTPLFGGADIVTGECTPILTGHIEQHITADIAYAVWQYAQATGDAAFMDAFGWEILTETGRFWASRATWDEQRQAYVIRDVIGPDEYKEHVDNNAYTNYMAENNMRLALQKLNDPDLRHIADGLWLPAPDENGVIPQFDGYMALQAIDLTRYRHAESVGDIFKDYNLAQINGLQVSKQSDTVLLLLLLAERFPPEVRRQSYLFYEARTLHDSSLSKATHCVLAQDLGLDGVAYDYFRAACAVDLPISAPKSAEGIHSAAMGGIWQCVAYGFAGVRMVDGALRIAPRLPAGWRSLAFRIVWQMQPLAVEADASGVRVTNLGSLSVSVCLYGQSAVIAGGATFAAAAPA